MMQGMTGFGASEKGGFRVEVRSLNHRFLDVSVKMPYELGIHEMAIRDVVRGKFRRGRLEVYVSRKGEAAERIAVDMKAAGKAYEALRSLKEEFSLSGGISVESLLFFKDMIFGQEEGCDEGALLDAVREAASGLEAMRLKEGGLLREEMDSRLRAVEAMNETISSLCPLSMDRTKDKFIENVRGLLGDSVRDEARLLQEACLAAERMDITEEVTRMRGHVAHMRKILSEGDAIGRKLDFLLQEMNREANTLASKSDDIEILRIAIEMKTEVERLREQAQNIQ